MSEADKGLKQNFKTLLQNYPINFPKAGDTVKGQILAIDKGEIKIDINGIAIGVVRGPELFIESREYGSLKVGDEAEATVLEEENENGEMELSFRAAGQRHVWDNLEKLIKSGITIKSRVISANKGGLMMQVDAVAGFMPVSQLSPEHYPRVAGGDKDRILEKLKEIIGKELEVKVIDANERDEKLIVSEKAVWEDAQKAVLESYKIGDIVDGEVSALTPFGAFIKFGEGLEGLIHISEIAWQRISHPREILKVGDNIKAQIIQLDRSKIYLSIKRLVEDPWKSAKAKYKVNDKVKGKVVKIEPYGLMIALDNEIHGLAHISELSDEPIDDIANKFKMGEEYEFEILSLEPSEHRLGLKIAGVKGKIVKEEKKEKENAKEAVEEKAEVKEAEDKKPEEDLAKKKEKKAKKEKVEIVAEVETATEEKTEEK
ncbi:MAG: S1 RNA-binding domain-containing protein [Patescibacteria group bacterium]|nr:S1 RNA-binding domain-containing protein [Patescibacteria group bacterium]